MFEAGFMDMEAAASFGNGFILVDKYDPEIVDLTRKAGVLGQRIKTKPATGNPSRWVQQNGNGSAQFSDGHTLAYTPYTANRGEGSVSIKAVTGSVDFGLLDTELHAQQNIFASLVAHDIQDMISAMLLVRDKNVWTGNDTSLSSPTTIEFVGLKTQLTNTASVGASAKIITSLRTKVAAMCANTTFIVKPTAIYVNPLLLDFMEQEVEASPQTFKNIFAKDYQVVAGVQVQGIYTAAGILPVIPDPFLPYVVNGSDGTKNDYPAVILTEDQLELHYVTTSKPRIFQLGLVQDLATKYRGVMFQGLVAKYAATHHAWVTVTR